MGKLQEFTQKNEKFGYIGRMSFSNHHSSDVLPRHTGLRTRIWIPDFLELCKPGNRPFTPMAFPWMDGLIDG